MPVWFRLVAASLLPFLLAGCVVEVNTYAPTPPEFKTHIEKRQAAVRTYGYSAELTRSQISNPYRNRVTERLLLSRYYVPRDIMCFRWYTDYGTKVILCSFERELDRLLRLQHRGYIRTAELTLMPHNSYIEDPVYTSFFLRGQGGYSYPYRW